MSLPRLRLTSLLAGLLILLTVSTAALADCANFDNDRLSKLTDDQIAELQLGLRSAYEDTNVFLRDGQLGGYTRNMLRTLCEGVPRPPGQDDLSATLNLTTEYADMTRAYPDWPRNLYSQKLTDEAGKSTDPLLGLRLAGTIAMKTLAMGRRALVYDCADPLGALTDYPNGTRAMGVLTRLYRDKSAEEICQMLPVAGGVADWQQAMERLGQIASGARTGALSVLQSDGFQRWVDTGPTARDRLRRLAGTVPAVLALLDEYDAQAAPTPGGTNYFGGPCTPPRIESSTTYYALEQADVDSLDFLVSLTPKLDAFRAEAGGFDNPQSLWRALRPVLAEDLDDCILAEIETLVKGPDRLPLAFLIKPAAVESLQSDPQLETAIPVLKELEPLRTATKAELVNRIRAALQDVQEAAVGAEVTAAADTLAAASEPGTPVFDTPILTPEEDVEADAPPPAPVITVTDATDAAVESAVDNPELTETLRNTPLTDATVPELLRSQVRQALEDTAARQAGRLVDAQIALIEPAVRSEWALTEDLQAEILAIPYVKATTADATADGAAERLVPLVAAEYPSYRLFNDALRTISQEPGKVPFSTFVTERILQKAQKTIPDPQTKRRMGPLAIEDCGCIPLRQSEDLTVYGFYPFWLAPTVADADRAAGTTPEEEAPAAEAAGDETPPQQQTLVDFGTIDQIAFYGLEFRANAQGDVTLFHHARWREAKEIFVNSAHHYRARADLAFDLRDWTTWTDADIEKVVEDITAEMAPFDRLRSFETGDLGEAIPTLFDRTQPDGVTLIFHDYDGVGLGKAQMTTMIRIIKSVYESLPNRDQLNINVAFDFPLVEETTNANGETEFKPILDKPVFDALYQLLQSRPYVFVDENTEAEDFDLDAQSREVKRVVNNILLFLERPTTDAKKGLRFRMELGLFQGELRRQVLRSIIPVLPPAGHREIRTSIKPNDPDQSPRDAFSQFEDDVVYFKDNFAGLGFWPLPDPLNPDRKEETEKLFSIIAANFNAPRLPPLMASFEAPLDGVCTYACPNRAKITLAAMALFLALVLMTWRSFYSGLVDKIAFRFLAVGAVWIGNGVLLVTLVVLSVCDPLAVWPGILWKALIAILGLLLFYNFIQRIKNGPMP